MCDKCVPMNRMVSMMRRSIVTFGGIIQAFTHCFSTWHKPNHVNESFVKLNEPRKGGWTESGMSVRAKHSTVPSSKHKDRAAEVGMVGRYTSGTVPWGYFQTDFGTVWKTHTSFMRPLRCEGAKKVNTGFRPTEVIPQRNVESSGNSLWWLIKCLQTHGSMSQTGLPGLYLSVSPLPEATRSHQHRQLHKILSSYRETS